MAAAVPAISSAAIQAIKDPSVQLVVRALADGVAVRNGDIGNGDQAFLTLAGLRDNRPKALEVAKAIAGPLAQQIGSHSELSAMADSLRDRILKSPTWLSMFSRLETITAPDSVPGSAAYMLLREAKARGAAIARVESAVQTTNESLATTRETLTAAIGDAAAAISEERTVRTTVNDAFAEQLRLMIAATGESFAGVQEQLTLRTNNDNALAEAINTIWARVGSNEALVQSGTKIAVNGTGSTATKFDQLQATVTGVTGDLAGALQSVAAIRQDLTVTNSNVTGLAGKWSIKIDLNGYVSGVALNSGVTPEGVKESMFIVAADVFAIGAPGKPAVVPFAIDARTGLVSINGSLIATGTVGAAQLMANSVQRGHLALKVVGGAQIDDLAVDTLKLANQSVTTMEQFNDWISGIGGGPNNAGNKYSNFDFYMAHPGDAYVIVTSQFFSQYHKDDYTKVTVTVGDQTFPYIERWGETAAAPPNVIIGKASLSRGWQTVSVRNEYAELSPVNQVVNTTSIVVFRAYK